MAAEYVRVHNLPELHHPAFVVAFQGWPDAGEVASAALRYLIRNLGAARFAEVLPEEFYVFTETRPHAIQVRPGQRGLRWPSNEFFYWRHPSGGRDLVLFLGREPDLKWGAYTSTVLDLAERCGTTLLVTLGGTYDTVSHHGEPLVSGVATTPRLRQTLESFEVQFSQYQGPSSVHSALLQSAKQRELPAASLWGHAPHYIQSVPNVKVCHALLEKLAILVEVRVDLQELKAASRALEARVDEALAENPELQDYVRRIEAGLLPEHEEEDEGWDEEALELPTEMPSPDVVLAELEEFLRRSKRRTDDEPDYED